MYAYTVDGWLKERLRGVGAERALLFEDVSLIDGSGSPPRSGASVLVRGGLIDTVFPSRASVDVPAEPAVERISLNGCFVMPGFIHCHVHFTGLEGRDPFRKNIQQYPSIRLIRAVRDANLEAWPYDLVIRTVKRSSLWAEALDGQG
jgi:imidazolonepropionase-like amidohydrolase